LLLIVAGHPSSISPPVLCPLDLAGSISGNGKHRIEKFKLIPGCLRPENQLSKHWSSIVILCQFKMPL
jgi:hypothetical protein